MACNWLNWAENGDVINITISCGDESVKLTVFKINSRFHLKINNGSEETFETLNDLKKKIKDTHKDLRESCRLKQQEEEARQEKKTDLLEMLAQIAEEEE